MSNQNGIRQKRVFAELNNLKNKNPEHPDWNVQASESNMFLWTVTLPGPEDTPFKYGTYRISVAFPENYPFSGPTIKFITKIYHPNVYGNGDICVDILKEKWDKTVQIPALLRSLWYLIQYPNPDDAANGQAADFFRNSEENYEKEILNKILETGEVNEKFRDEFEQKLKKHGLINEAKKNKMENENNGKEDDVDTGNDRTTENGDNSAAVENSSNISLPIQSTSNTIQDGSQNNTQNSATHQDNDFGQDAELQRARALAMSLEDAAFQRILEQSKYDT